jgi:hypothetical protein
MVAPPLVALPVLYDEAAQRYKVVTASRLLEVNCRYGNKWFKSAEEEWEANRTAKNGKTTLAAYLNHLNKLVAQSPAAKYLVLYTSSATDASAVVIQPGDLDLPFIVDHKTYWCAFATQLEAHYVCAFVNSPFANESIKDFQSRGLFGPRDIHKLILKVPLPKFRRREPLHETLAALGEECAAEAQRLISGLEVADLRPHALGAMRGKLRDVLGPKLTKIDLIVERLATERESLEAGGNRIRVRRTTPTSGELFD